MPRPSDEALSPRAGLERDLRAPVDYGESSYVGFGRLAGRRALVTGGESGLGRAVALAFAREGAEVAFTHPPGEQRDADETARVVRTAGRKAFPIVADLADSDSCERVVRSAAHSLGGLDILVHNAAVQDEAVRAFEELAPARVTHTFQVSVLAMFHLVRAALVHMPAGSSIVNVAWFHTHQPSASLLDHAATTGAIVSFTKGLARELAGRGIRVNCVAPGPVWTPLVAASHRAEERLDGAAPPMRRPVQPAELAPAFVFLASDEGRYVSGEILGVAGGETLG